MDRASEVMHHEVRLRAGAWARRLVQMHGGEAEEVVRATLRRPDLTERELLAARFTRDALADFRRQQRFAEPPRRRALPQRRFAWLFWFRKRAPAPDNRLPHL